MPREFSLFEELHMFHYNGDSARLSAKEKLFRLPSRQCSRPLEGVDVAYIYNYLKFEAFLRQLQPQTEIEAPSSVLDENEFFLASSACSCEIETWILK